MSDEETIDQRHAYWRTLYESGLSLYAISKQVRATQKSVRDGVVKAGGAILNASQAVRQARRMAKASGKTSHFKRDQTRAPRRNKASQGMAISRDEEQRLIDAALAAGKITRCPPPGG